MPTPSDPSGSIQSKQFSSKMSGDPIELYNQVSKGPEAHADLMDAYGLGMPVALPGQHPWLRDGCAVTTGSEPGQAEPNGTRGFPMDVDKGD